MLYILSILLKPLEKKNLLNLVTQKLTWDSQGKNLEKSGKSQGILKTRHHVQGLPVVKDIRRSNNNSHWCYAHMFLSQKPATSCKLRR